MIGLIASLVGEKWARPVFYAALAVLALGIFGAVKCSVDRREVEQAKQATRSSDAMADSAENAVAQIVATSNNEKSVDEVVTQAAREIDNAPTSQDARKAAVKAVCQLPEYAKDPACE